jgi:ATP-dependent phosphofructokinase / diphosphate-dependent phosphofructokinase
MRAAGGNLLVLQGGGPTPVLNTSLFGVLDEARRDSRIPKLFGARFGIHGVIKGDLLDLSGISADQIAALRSSPGASLGSTRYKPAEPDMERIIACLKRYDIRYLMMIGGNGTLRGAHAIAQAAEEARHEIRVIGIPKTIDNDIVGTDRSPGYGSAARYLAQAVRDLGMDVRGLPQPVSIIETMGRGVGWIAGASVLARLDENHCPHRVELPERPFDASRFLAAIDRAVRRLGWAVAVVSEGICDASGKAVFEVADCSQRDAMNRPLTGGVGAYLAELVTRELKIRCRCEKPGLCGRSSMLHVSRQDQADAEAVGRAAVRAALAGEHAKMVSLLPLDADAPPRCQMVALTECAGEKKIPADWIDESDLAVTDQFVNYVRPLVGDLVEYATPLREMS